MKVNLGCGSNIRLDYLNVDCFPLPGVNVIHDLTRFPWPFERNSMDEVLMVHVLEHLPNTVKAMEEVWRIARPGALVKISVPFWNSEDFVTDPTHVKMFGAWTFDFFDPRTVLNQERSYVTEARFWIKKKRYIFKVFGRYYVLPSWTFFFMFQLLGLIQVMEVELEAVK